MSTYRSPLYWIWVVGGLIAIVAFTVIGGLSDPTNQDFPLYVIPAVAVWVAGILALQWRGFRREVSPEREKREPVWGWAGWNLRFAMVVCAAIFIGVFLFYAGVDETLYPLGESGPGVPVVLIPAVLAVFVGAAHTVHNIRNFGKGERIEITDLPPPRASADKEGSKGP